MWDDFAKPSEQKESSGSSQLELWWCLPFDSTAWSTFWTAGRISLTRERSGGSPPLPSARSKRSFSRRTGLQGRPEGSPETPYWCERSPPPAWSAPTEYRLPSKPFADAAGPVRPRSGEPAEIRRGRDRPICYVPPKFNNERKLQWQARETDACGIASTGRTAPAAHAGINSVRPDGQNGGRSGMLSWSLHKSQYS